MDSAEATLPQTRFGAALEHYRGALPEALAFVVRRSREVQLAQVASSLTFTTTLSIVPLMTIGFAVLTTLPVFEHIQTDLHELLLRNLMPADVSDTIFRHLNNFAAKARGLTVIGIVFLGVTAVSMMLTFDRALNTIWRVRRSRPLHQRILVYWSVLTLGPFLLGISLSLSSYLASASAGLIQKPPVAIALLIDLVPLVLLTLGYAAIYVYVPNRPVRWRDALIGGSIAAIAFELAKRGFAVYIARFPTYTAIYGALAALPIFLLWVYLSWYITLIGATIAAIVPALIERHWRDVPAAGEVFVDALRVLRALHQARARALPGLTLHEVNEASGVVPERLLSVLEVMEAAGFVLRTRPVARDGPTRTLPDELWMLAVAPEMVRVGELFRMFAFDGAELAKTAILRDDPLVSLLEATPAQSLGWTLEAAFAPGGGGAAA
jgi:membrane protein